MRLTLPIALALLAPLPIFAQETWREPLTGIEFVRMPAGCYVMGDTFMPGDFPQFPGGKAPQWTAIALPGQEADAGAVLDSNAVNNVIVPRAFAELLYPLLAPGTVMVATDAQIGATGSTRQVLDADPRDASGTSH